MNIPAKISIENGQLVIRLPLTNPTGKIRVKRKSLYSNYGLPISPRKTKFTDKDYVEWQISYATKNPPEDSKVEDIVINNDQIGFELTKLLCEGLLLGILSNDDFNEMENFISEVQQGDTLEENENIIREDKFQEIKGGFRKFEERIPIFIKTNDEKGYFIEIILKHKQRAVGLQAMIYLCIYIGKLKDKDGKYLIGRTANTKEFGEIKITTTNKELIKDTVKAFAIASQTHKRDILNILKQVREKCRQR